MSKSTTDMATKLLSAVTTAQSVLDHLSPASHKAERDSLKQSIIKMRDVYARLMKGATGRGPNGD